MSGQSTGSSEQLALIQARNNYAVQNAIHDCWGLPPPSYSASASRVLKAGVTAFNGELKHQGAEIGRAAGDTLKETVVGAIGLVDDALGALVSTPILLANSAMPLVGNPALIGEDAQGMWAHGLRNFQSANDVIGRHSRDVAKYTTSVVSSGDLSKPLRDAAEFAARQSHDAAHLASEEMDRREHRSTYEKAKEISNLLLAVPVLEVAGLRAFTARAVAQANELSVAERTRFFEEAIARCNQILDKSESTIAKFSKPHESESSALKHKLSETAELDHAESADVRGSVRRSDKSMEKPQHPNEDSEHGRELTETVKATIAEMVELRDDITSVRQDAVRNVLSRLPQQDVLQVHKAGYKILLTNGVRAAKDKFPDDYREGKGLKKFLGEALKGDTTAITIPQTKAIILFTNNGYTGTSFDARHEFAHAMADVCGWEKNQKLREAYDRIAGRLRTQFYELESGDRLDEPKYEELRKIKGWFEGEPNLHDDRFYETVADMYAIAHGGSRDAGIDMILEDKFGELLKLMQDVNWFRPKV